MSQISHIELVEQLSRNSRPYRDPLTRIDWERFDHDSYWLPKTALSLHGVAAFAALPDERQRALSQQEYLHVISLHAWLKSLFIEKSRGVLTRPTANTALSRYRLHELREHAGHALMVFELLKRNGSTPYHMPAARSRTLEFLTRLATPESTVYQLLALMGAELPDRLHRIVRQHRAEICPAVYDMVNILVIDATRHITQARDALEETRHRLSSKCLPWQRAVARFIFRRIVSLLFYPPADVYERAGLKPGSEWLRAAAANLERRRFINNCIAPTRRLLAQSGFEVDWQ
ncbi:MAG: diiron oxygenase [Gammaproteobacteria bacterium]